MQIDCIHFYDFFGSFRIFIDKCIFFFLHYCKAPKRMWWIVENYNHCL